MPDWFTNVSTSVQRPGFQPTAINRFASGPFAINVAIDFHVDKTDSLHFPRVLA
jgi:hypothetical protein